MRNHVLTTIILAATVGACSGTSDSGTADARLDVLNALSLSDAVTLNLDQELFPMPSAGHSAGMPIASGTHYLAIKSSGGAILASTYFTLATGTRRTVVMSGGATNSLALLVAVDTASIPPANAAKVRVVHTAEGAPAMNAQLYLTGATVDSSAGFVTPFSYGTGLDSQFPGYAVRPLGVYTVRAVVPGTSTVLAEAQVTLGNEQLWSAVLSWSPSHTLQFTVIKEGAEVLTVSH